MIVGEIQGITDLNGWTTVNSTNTNGEESIGRMTLRQVLMKSLKISDGNSLFAEVHQLPAPLSPVHVVVPHTPEAEQMILMMNKNFPAYISFVLEDQGLSKDFI
jgi:hypothetical protein